MFLSDKLATSTKSRRANHLAIQFSRARALEKNDWDGGGAKILNACQKIGDKIKESKRILLFAIIIRAYTPTKCVYLLFKIQFYEDRTFYPSHAR